MRRRRSRNRSESASGGDLLARLPRLLLLLVVLLPIAEWGASVIMSRLATPARQVPYSDKELAKLYDSAEPGRSRQVLLETPGVGEAVYAPLVEYRLAPQSGQFVNIDGNGVRGGRVGGQGPRVAVFGGVSTFGHGLTDDETVPFALGAALARDGRPVRVENHAQPGWYSTQDRIAFAQMLATGDKPDVAVFIHGLEDFLHCGRPERTAWSPRLAGTGEPVGLQQVVRQSALAALGRRLTGQADPSQPVERDEACASDAQVESALARLDANRRLIAAMGERFGVPVLFVQQPVPTYHYDNAKRAVPLQPEQMAPFVATAKAYPRLAEMRGTGRLWEKNLVWLADLEPESANAYVDPVNYSPAFAKLIGETLAKTVADLLPAPPADPAQSPAPAGGAAAQ